MRCFLISVIGEKDSRERHHAEWLRKDFLNDISRIHGITIIRGDDIDQLGQISDQIIKALQEYEISIADLTYDNLNVYFELGYRMATGKPVVLVADSRKTGQLPFDIRGFRIIFYDRLNPAEGMRQLGNMLGAVAKKIATSQQQMAKNAGLSLNSQGDPNNPVLWWDDR